MLAKVGEEDGTYNLVKHYSSPNAKLEFAWPIQAWPSKKRQKAAWP